MSSSAKNKSIDLNDTRLKIYDNYSSKPTWDDVEGRRNWQQENFIFVREHDYQKRPEAIWSGKDGKTILVEHRDYSREYYYDQYWDIYQKCEDGSVAVKKMTIEEIDIGRGDSIPMTGKISDEKIEGGLAAAVHREIDVCNTLREFYENRRALKKRAEKEFLKESFIKLLYPHNDGHDVETQHVVSDLPDVLFGSVAHDIDLQEEHSNSFYEWLGGKTSGFYHYRDNKFPKKYDKHVFDEREQMHYDPAEDVLVITHRVPYEEENYGEYHQIYEFISDHIVRTTVEVSREENGTFGGKRYYLTGIKKQIVSYGDEVSRILQERAVAIEIVRSQMASDIFNKKLEADTKTVSYKASGPVPI